jgi:pseudouridylate synthase
VSPALVVSDEVRAALAGDRGAVALETSVIGQGLPFPRNLECVERMSAVIRANGATPAWIGAIDGAVKVGLSDDELARFAEPGRAMKVARRDLPIATAAGALGATTVSATIWAARAARIAVAATGGIGGVHPGEEDVSADLLELARTPVLLVCSGPKSIIDPVATADRLEELGVALVGYRCDRLPFFLARESPVEMEHRVDTPSEAAAIARALTELGAGSAILLCNPIPAADAMDAAEVAAASRACEERARREGVRGKARTPFLLSCLAEATGGRSLEANLSLLEANAALAADVAVGMAAGRRSPPDPATGARSSRSPS